MPSGMTCIEAPLRVQRGHVRRPGHSPQRTVSDGYTCLGIGSDCSDCNCDGGIGLRRGCDRRMRSSSLARSRDVPCSGRRKRHIRISETSTWISTRILCKSLLLGGVPSLCLGFISSRVGGVVAVPGSGVPLGGYRWYTVGTVRAVGPWTVDSPVGALVGP